MQQLLSAWFAIDSRRRAIVALSALVMFVAVLGLSRLATTPSMSLLYSGLEPGASGEVVRALEQQGVAFKIQNNTILVDSARRDELRMLLASEGLPTNNGQGYELLDGLSGFGTTAQMFDAAYWRAKEGELARTIVSGPLYKQARVHISNSSSQPFRKTSVPTASVTVTTSSGAISGARAKALKFLVSSAIAGMAPTNVSIIDGRNGVVIQDDSSDGGTASGGERAGEIKLNIERLLEARVGAGNVVVEVFVETVTDRETITERQIDPDSRVAISSQKDERTTSSNDTRAGAVTVASNLPEGDGSAADNNSSSSDTETSEQTNYDFSQTTRELLRVPGSIKRLSVAVLVDGVFETDPVTNTKTWAKRSDTELAALHGLVASAVGFNAERGDTITLESLQFEPPEQSGVSVENSLLRSLNIDIMRLVQLVVLAVVILVLGLFVLRPILTSSPVPALQGPQGMSGLPNLMPNAETARPEQQALTGEIDEGAIFSTSTPALQQSAPAPTGLPALPSDPVDKLRELIADRQDETVEILRTWIDGSEERV